MLTHFFPSDCLEGIDAIPCFGYHVIYRGDEIQLPYPYKSEEKAQRYEGRSFHHGRFIQNLRQAAMKEPNITIVETKAESLIKDEGSGQILGVECTTRGAKDYV
jgi:squalene monooxygenase